jgi:hypothetical protein
MTDTNTSRSLTAAEIAAKRALAQAQRRIAPAPVAPLPLEHSEPVPVYAAPVSALRAATAKAPGRTRVIHTKLTEHFGARLDRLTHHIRQTTRRRSGDNVTIETAITALEEKFGLPPLTLQSP